MTTRSSHASYLKKPPLPLLDRLAEMKHDPETTEKGLRMVILFREDEAFMNLCPFVLWTQEVTTGVLGELVAGQVYKENEGDWPLEARLVTHKKGTARLRIFGLFNTTGMRCAKVWPLVQMEMNSAYTFYQRWTEERSSTVYRFLATAMNPLLRAGSSPWMLALTTLPASEVAKVMSPRERVEADIDRELASVNNSIQRLSETKEALKMKKENLQEKCYPLAQFLGQVDRKAAEEEGMSVARAAAITAGEGHRATETVKQSSNDSSKHCPRKRRFDPPPKQHKKACQWQNLLPAKNDFLAVNEAAREDPGNLEKWLRSQRVIGSTQEVFMDNAIATLIHPLYMTRLRWRSGLFSEEGRKSFPTLASFSKDVKDIWRRVMVDKWHDLSDNKEKRAVTEETLEEWVKDYLLENHGQKYLEPPKPQPQLEFPKL